MISLHLIETINTQKLVSLKISDDAAAAADDDDDEDDDACLGVGPISQMIVIRRRMITSVIMCLKLCCHASNLQTTE